MDVGSTEGGGQVSAASSSTPPTRETRLHDPVEDEILEEKFEELHAKLQKLRSETQLAWFVEEEKKRVGSPVGISILTFSRPSCREVFLKDKDQV